MAKVASTALYYLLFPIVRQRDHVMNSLIERDHQKVPKILAYIEAHLLAPPIENLFQRNQGKKAYCVNHRSVVCQNTGQQLTNKSML